MDTNKSKLYFLLLEFAIGFTASCYVIVIKGLTPISVLVLAVTCVIFKSIVNNHNAYQEKLKVVLKALANNDSTLGLSYNDPLLKEFTQVKIKILQSRDALQSQHQFLQSMLSHLDIGILVIDEKNQILHKNPALVRLLGNLPDDLTSNAWQTLGHDLIDTDNSIQKLVTWQIADHRDTLSLRLSCSSLQGMRIKIISLQSISQALQNKEQQSYQRLIKVLTHEISNSVMPIASLAETGKALVQKRLAQLDESDLLTALTAIENRASHLHQFISQFSKVASLPSPSLNKVNLFQLLENALNLYQHQLKEQHISLDISAQNEELCLTIDKIQIEQVCINLLKNAIEALENSHYKKIKIMTYSNNQDQTVVEFQDSGADIAPDIQDQIFVPFFTTKQKGSGIGLSLCKQILINHNGLLLYVPPCERQKELNGACFRMVFK